jgi:hypothetical protein
MDRFPESQDSHLDVKRQKNKAKQETSHFSRRLLGFGLSTMLLLGKAGGNALPDLSRPKDVGYNHYLRGSHHPADYSPPLPPSPGYLKKSQNPSWNFVGPKDALNPREIEIDKNASQSLNKTNDAERIPQNEEFRKIILKCQKPEFVKVCLALANKKGLMEDFEPDGHCAKFLSELCKDPELARDCIALANNQEIVDHLKQDAHYMKFLNELCKKDPEFMLTCITLMKNNKPLDNDYPPLDVTDVKGNLDATQEENHGLDTTQNNIKSQKRLARKLLQEDKEVPGSREVPTINDKFMSKFIDKQLPPPPSLAEKMADHHMKLTEMSLKNTNLRDNIVLALSISAAVGVAILGGCSHRQLDKQLTILRQDYLTVVAERNDLKRTMIDPSVLEVSKRELEVSKRELEASQKALEALQKELEVSKNLFQLKQNDNVALARESQAFQQQNKVLADEKASAVQIAEKYAADNQRLKFEAEAKDRENRMLQENQQKEIQKLKEEIQNSQDKLKNLQENFQRVCAIIPPHEQYKIQRPSPLFQGMW